MAFHSSKLFIQGNCKNIQLLFTSFWIKFYTIILAEILPILYEGPQVTDTQKITNNHVGK